jgi:hypothetical protein
MVQTNYALSIPDMQNPQLPSVQAPSLKPAAECIRTLHFSLLDALFKILTNCNNFKILKQKSRHGTAFAKSLIQKQVVYLLYRAQKQRVQPSQRTNYAAGQSGQAMECQVIRGGEKMISQNTNMYECHRNSHIRSSVPQKKSGETISSD